MPRERVDTQNFMQSMQFFRRVFDIDIEATYERLKTVGKLNKQDLKDKHKVIEALNDAGENSVLANRIYLKAVKEMKLFVIDFNREKRDLSHLVLERIEDWLDMLRSKRKAITKDMVEEEIAAHADTRDKYRELVEKRERFSEIVGNLKKLSEEWSERRSSLQTHSRLLTSQTEVVLGDRS